MGRDRCSKSSSLNSDEKATKTRVSDKDRVKREENVDGRHGRGDDLKGITDLRHRDSGTKRYKEGKESTNNRYKEKQKSLTKEVSSSQRKESNLEISREEKEAKKARHISEKESVRKGKEHSSDIDKSKSRYKKESNETDRYREEKYQDERPKEKYQNCSSNKHEWYTEKHWHKDKKLSDKYWDEDDREKHYYRDDHKYTEERKATKYRDEDARGIKRKYVEKDDFGELKGRNAKERRGEMDKHVPRPDKIKIECLPSDNCPKSTPKSDTISTKGQKRNNNVREAEEYAQKGLSLIPEKPYFCLPSQNNRTNTCSTETLTYSQLCIHKDNLMENLTHFSSSRLSPSNSNNWNRDEMVPFQYQGFQRPGFQPTRGENSSFYNYGGWENNYNNCNTNINGNNNNWNDSWNKTSNVPFWPWTVSSTGTYCPPQNLTPVGLHSTVQQSPFGIRSETSEWTQIKVPYNWHGEKNPFPSNQNPLIWHSNSVAAMPQKGTSAAPTDKPKPNSLTFSNLESAEPKKPDNMGLSISASDRPPDHSTCSSMKNDRSGATNLVERTPFPHDYYLSKIGVSSDLVPPDLYKTCMSILQSGADRASSVSSPEKLQNEQIEKGVTRRGSNGILKYFFPNRTKAISQKSLSHYATTTGKFTELNQPATSISPIEGQKVAFACTNIDKMEMDVTKEEKLSIEIRAENSANSDKQQKVAVPGDDSMEMEFTPSTEEETKMNIGEFDMISSKNVVFASGAQACEAIFPDCKVGLSQIPC